MDGGPSPGRRRPRDPRQPSGLTCLMPRFKLTIEYDGAAFVGWQRQDNGLSVQEVLETAVERYCQIKGLVQGAGRTDAGVHALAQVAHVDLPRNDRPEVVANALNAHLRPHL